jgi:adenylate cyclase
VIESSTVVLPPAVQPARVLVWFLHLALPVLGLWLLLARPTADLTWEHHGGHFWLVVVVAAGNVVLGLRMGSAARRHTDARLFLVSLAFLCSAGFLLLHALATPGVLVRHPNAGFDVAQPVGLALAAVFAVVSCLSFPATRAVFRALVVVRALVAALLVVWAVVSLLDLPPLNQPPPARDVEGPLTTVAIVAVVLYVTAAVRYYVLHRRAPAAVLLSLVTAFALR